MTWHKLQWTQCLYDIYDSPCVNLTNISFLHISPVMVWDADKQHTFSLWKLTLIIALNHKSLRLYRKSMTILCCKFKIHFPKIFKYKHVIFIKYWISLVLIGFPTICTKSYHLLAMVFSCVFWNGIGWRSWQHWKTYSVHNIIPFYTVILVYNSWTVSSVNHSPWRGKSVHVYSSQSDLDLISPWHTDKCAAATSDMDQYKRVIDIGGLPLTRDCLHQFLITVSTGRTCTTFIATGPLDKKCLGTKRKGAI